MSPVMTALLAGGVSLVLATSAFAQAGETGRAEAADQWNLDPVPAGSEAAKSSRMTIGKTGHATPAASNPALGLPAKTLIYKKNGKLYLVTNKTIPERVNRLDPTAGRDGE